MQEPVLLPDWVIYHGPASQKDLLEKWFPHATGLISLSRHPEGRPQVMLEAMAAGLPIVASDLAPHIELVERFEAGMICRSQNDLAAALESMEAAEGVSSGARGREAVSRQYGNWDDCAARYAAVYRTLTQP
jgi:glycosyltransferase involved in cell wall biosynthesis